MHALNPTTPYSLTTINETRDLHIPQLYVQPIPNDPTITQMYMHETDYQFQIPAINYKDNLFSRATKATNLFHFWITNYFNFLHPQVIFIQPNKLEILNLPTSNFLFDPCLSFEKLNRKSYENFHSHHTLNSNTKIFSWTT